MRINKIKKYRWVLGLILILVIVAGWIVFNFVKENKSTRNRAIISTVSVSDTPNADYNRLDNINYAVGKDYVEFYYFLDHPEGINNSFATIAKTDYPKLFQGLDDMHEIIIKPFYSSDRLFYILENVYPDHFSISSDYGIVIDPFNKVSGSNGIKVLYETNDIYNSGSGSKIWATSEGHIQVSTNYKQIYRAEGGRTDGYVLIDFLSYDKTQNKFVTNNTSHKDEITKILEEIKKTGKDEIIFEKEYSNIIKTYESILDGKEKSSFDIER